MLEVHLVEGFPPAKPGRIEITFLRRLRSERKFPSREALAAQMAKDIAAATKRQGET